MSKSWIIAEITCFYLMILSLIWFVPEERISIAGLVVAGWILISWNIHHDNWDSLGLIKETRPFWTFVCLSLIGLYVIIVHINPVMLDMRYVWIVFRKNLGYLVWAVAQQFVLQSYLVNRLDKCCEKKWLTALIAGVLFSIIHFPNPILAIGSLFLGISTAYFFLNIRNLYVIILAHILLGSVVIHFIAYKFYSNGGEIGPYFLN